MEWSVEVETIQVVLDKKLLEAADRAALQTKRNRSALVRDALREHLRRLTLQSMEERDRAGYSERPSAHDASDLWESEAVWPKE
jgi:metal-responsive CopG/Arc/MetJ family transcriptional regulator